MGRPASTMCFGARGLQDRAGLLVGVFGPDRHDEPKARADDVEPDALVLADPDPFLALKAGRNLGLHDLFDALQMRGKPGLVARGLARLAFRLRLQPRGERLKAGLHLFEGEALLFDFIGAELLGAFAEACSG